MFLEDIIAPEYDPNATGTGFVDPHGRDRSEHVEEVAGDKVQAEILTEQIQGERVADVAKKRGLDVRNTQVRVSRSRTRLGLPLCK